MIIIKIKNNINKYIRDNFIIYLLVVSMFLGGIVTGALMVKALPVIQVEELNEYLYFFISGFGSEIQLAPQEIFRESINNNLKYIFLLWIAGASVIGFPIILFLFFLRGFILGFTVGFLVNQIALKGMFFAAAAILPHNLLIIPVLIAAGVTGLSYSLNIIKLRWNRRKFNISQLLFIYSAVMFVMVFFMLVGSLIEACITPVFMSYIIGII